MALTIICGSTAWFVSDPVRKSLCNEQPSQATASPVGGKACSPTKGGLLCYIVNTYLLKKVSSSNWHINSTSDAAYMLRQHILPREAFPSQLLRRQDFLQNINPFHLHTCKVSCTNSLEQYEHLTVLLWHSFLMWLLRNRLSSRAPHLFSHQTTSYWQLPACCKEKIFIVPKCSQKLFFPNSMLT